MLASDVNQPSIASDDHEIAELRSRCRGEMPLDGRLQRWSIPLLVGEALFDLIATHGSPLNLISAAPMVENLACLKSIATQKAIDFEVYFARKANKCIAFVDCIAQQSAGIDAASEAEIRQSLAADVPASRIICTAAIKSDRLLELCVASGVTIAIDNIDELISTSAAARNLGRAAAIALRIDGFLIDGNKHRSRFGFDIDHLASLEHQLSKLVPNLLRLTGLHFHLASHIASDRAAAISQLLPWIDRLSLEFGRLDFLDIGGGFPVQYLASPNQWPQFWEQHQRALAGGREMLTFQGHALGACASNDRTPGHPNVYPQPSAASASASEWLADVLSTSINDRGHSCQVAQALRRRGLQLRCEPGRSLLDGCGVTVARVEHCKPWHGTDSLVGISMSHTQCRTTHDEFMVDPLVLHRQNSDRPAPAGRQGFLTGGYCTQHEPIFWRRFIFPQGIARGDLIVIPNTAGYMMHFMETSAHQLPLAKNMLVTDRGIVPDKIDHGT